MIDMYPLETEAFIQKVPAMDWERLIPGHPGPNDRLGTKKDAEDQLALLRAGLGRDEETGARRQVLGYRREGVQALRLRELAGPREQPAVHRAALLRVMGARDLMASGEPAARGGQSRLRAAPEVDTRSRRDRRTLR